MIPLEFDAGVLQSLRRFYESSKMSRYYSKWWKALQIIYTISIGLYEKFPGFHPILALQASPHISDWHVIYDHWSADHQNNPAEEDMGNTGKGLQDIHWGLVGKVAELLWHALCNPKGTTCWSMLMKCFVSLDINQYLHILYIRIYIYIYIFPAKDTPLI